MYKKLMFLISLVMLLGLVVNVQAAEIKWTNAADGDSWCTGGNWEGDVVPGPGDTALIDCDSSPDGPTINCDVDVGLLKGPAWDGDCDHEMAIVSGTVLIGEMERDRDFEDGTITFTISGGNITFADNFRFPDHGTVYVNISGGTLLCQSDFRGADEDDGWMEINISAGDVTVEEEMSIGDSGSGIIDVSGGSLTVNDVLKLVARRGDGSTTLKVRGTATVNITNDGIELQEDDDGNANLLMMGGTLDTTDLKIGMSDGNATCIVSDGVLTVSDTTYVPENDDCKGYLLVAGGLMKTCHLEVQDNGQVDLVGGTLEVTCSGSLTFDGGNLNITTGTLVLAGDQCGSLPSGITAYYVDAGGGCAGSRGTLNCVFDGVKTTVTANLPNVYKPWSPEPADGAVWQTVDAILCFCDGDYAYRNLIFLGTDPVAVENAGTSDPEYKGGYEPADPPVPGDCLDPDLALKNPISLQLWTTYYWRVKVVHQPGSPPPTPTQTLGDVWSFTTGCELIPGDINLDCVVNSTDYAMMADDWRVEVWFPVDVQP